MESQRHGAQAQALNKKSAGVDWKKILLQYWTPNDVPLRLADQVCHDTTLTTAEERVQRFASLGGRSRATFMRKQKKLRDLLGDRAAA